jgi:hypothetical protein
MPPKLRDTPVSKRHPGAGSSGVPDLLGAARSSSEGSPLTALRHMAAVLVLIPSAYFGLFWYRHGLDFGVSPWLLSLVVAPLTTGFVAGLLLQIATWQNPGRSMSGVLTCFWIALVLVLLVSLVSHLASDAASEWMDFGVALPLMFGVLAGAAQVPAVCIGGYFGAKLVSRRRTSIGGATNG